MKAKFWTCETDNPGGGVTIHDMKFTLREAVLEAAKHPTWVVRGPFAIDVPTALDNPKED